ncbi:MAG: hypothetical protein IJ168_11870 [Eubacterium sp.]|nr:hypothetical protein [Eubacterium sp.]
MSKESKLAKKEKKAAKKAAKLEKSQAAQYAKLCKNIDKKNAKGEKKANKKGKPYTPIPTPTQEEAFAAASGGKVKRIISLILLILLIWCLVYFLVMWFGYVAPSYVGPAEETTEAGTAAVYERYSNPHEITTTPDYSVAEAKVLLKQVLHDNWSQLGYSSDPSTGSINYTSNIVNVNHSDCYVFTAGSKTYAVSVKLSSVYVNNNGKYEPLTFHDDEILFD